MSLTAVSYIWFVKTLILFVFENLVCMALVFLQMRPPQMHVRQQIGAQMQGPPSYQQANQPQQRQMVRGMQQSQSQGYSALLICIQIVHIRLRKLKLCFNQFNFRSATWLWSNGSVWNDAV